jgi:hypothetical protein
MQAPESMLSPNLHFATCQLLRQELRRGPAAFETDWFMDRCELWPFFYNLFYCQGSIVPSFCNHDAKNATTKNYESEAENIQKGSNRAVEPFIIVWTFLATFNACGRDCTHPNLDSRRSAGSLCNPKVFVHQLAGLLHMSRG